MPLLRARTLRAKVHFGPLCSQEVQSTHFADFWRPRLAEDGYDAIFKKKGNDMYISGNVAAIDGCATFFKRSRFNLVKKYEVLLHPLMVAAGFSRLRLVDDHPVLTCC